MPPETNEEDKESRPTSSIFNIVAWWRKFHFSGRVIVCSVLLGLGLVLIGSLIFAINLTDDNNKPNTDGSPVQVPTKAPSNYTGPVVMGIGGFIVVMGVIMCLFETQVCRKKTGDSSPLISEKTEDPERKDPDSAPGPSISQGHKSHRHGARKTCTSPKKSKSRQAKPRSKERNQQKSPSPKSPPVPIQPSKSFMTSSEDNFLTPPNTLDENATVVKKDESRNSEDKNSALMKSFTSSDPSWNQSTEFLTPSTSFRDTSVFLNNSVEIHENPEEKILSATELPEKQNISSEFMTPLTVEEDRIQQLLIRVKNEQKQMVESKKEINVGASDYSEPEKNFNSPQAQREIVTQDNAMGEKIEDKNSVSNMLLPESKSTTNNVNQELNTQIENANAHELSQNNYETNVSERNLNVVHNEVINEITNEDIIAAEDKISSQRDSTSLTIENEDPTVPESDKESSQDSLKRNDGQVELDSSVSSDETVVSPDSFQENPINNESSSENATHTALKENSSDESKSLSNTLESLDNDTTVVDNDGVDLPNNQDFPHQEEAESHGLSRNDDAEIEVFGIENKSKDETS